ncbi:hypothetical protein LCGC14_1348460 [marine sediment metagenome]|uniref:Glycosyltransferase 2-like domain-containing protein n=1 Tax=marine sediment metagenome TaxID=412755 RepID=A0A0F9KBM5_9ZZZZ
MTTNICMLVHNRHHHTKQAIESLYQNTPNTSFNLVVVDDGSSEETAGMLRDQRKLYGFYLSQLPWGGEPKGVGKSRNFAIGLVSDVYGQGALLYCSDNDVYFTEGWLAELIANFEIAEQIGFKLLGAYSHPYQQTEKVYAGMGDYGIHEKLAVASQSWLMRWETWYEYGPLDSHAKGIGQSEDVAFTNKIRESGWKVGTIFPDVVYSTGVTGSFGKPCPGADLVRKSVPKGVWYE